MCGISQGARDGDAIMYRMNGMRQGAKDGGVARQTKIQLYIELTPMKATPTHIN